MCPEVGAVGCRQVPGVQATASSLGRAWDPSAPVTLTEEAPGPDSCVPLLCWRKGQQGQPAGQVDSGASGAFLAFGQQDF